MASMPGKSGDEFQLSWRAPLSADWVSRWKVVDQRVRSLSSQADRDIEGLCLELRRLSGQRLGMSEQLKMEGTARRLIPLWEQIPLRKFRIGLVGNRTLSYLINPLRVAGLARGLLIDVLEAPYNSIASFAYGDHGHLANARLDAVLVIVDQDAFMHSTRLLDLEEEDRAVSQARALLVNLGSNVSRSLRAPTIVATLPAVVPSVSLSDIAIPGSPHRFIARINEVIAQGAISNDWIVWDLAAIASQVGSAKWFDPALFFHAKIPFRIEYCPLVADRLCGTIAAITGKSCRALVLDLDNTVWGGVIGDDGVDQIKIGSTSADGEAFLALQDFSLKLRRRGILLGVCSKNDDATAREPFRSHPDMLLREQDIAVFQANWDDKATNVRAIAKSMNLGLESICFVDDNPAERERVRQELPLVNVPEMGNDPAYFVQLLCDSGAFEQFKLNRDDLGRAQAFENNAGRVELQSKIGNYDEYLQSLEMSLTVSRFDTVGRSRIVQLINKSNQFNLTTRRYNENDVESLEADLAGTLCWQARLSDRFGDHGMIAVVVVKKAATTWTIDTWLMSCRVLMRGVEQALMNLLIEKARAEGITKVIGEYVPSGRNGMVADFFTRMGFSEIAGSAGSERREFECHTAHWTVKNTFMNIIHPLAPRKSIA